MSAVELPHLDFIGIGAGKCGTSWVYRNLAAHPEICMSTIKETNFFGRNYYRGPGWYSEQFAHCTPTQRRGEFSPAYFTDPVAIRRILATYPDIKFLMSVREPIARLKSHWQFDYERGKHNYTAFDEYANQVGDDTLKLSYYGRELDAHVLPFVPITRLHVILFDDIKDHPARVLQAVYEFVGVDSTFTPPAHDRPVLASLSTQPYFRLLNTAIFRLRSLLLNTPHLHWLLNGLKRCRVNFIARSILRANTRQRSITTLDATLAPETEARLRALYQPEIERLSDITGIDLCQRWGY